MAERWDIEKPTTLDLGSEAEPITAVDVRLVDGRVSVVAATTDDGTARLEVTDVTGDVPLRVTLEGGTLVVSHPKGTAEGLWGKLRTSWRDMSAQISITAPASADVRLAGVSAETLVAGMAAHVAVKTVSGEVVLDAPGSEVSANVVTGAVEVRNLSGALSVKSVSGDVTVHALALPKLAAKTVSGDVTVDLADAEAATLTSHQAANTVSGSVTVRLPPGAGYRVNATSVSGDLVAGGERLARSVGQTKGTLSAGNEAVRLDVATLSGDVTVLQVDA